MVINKLKKGLIILAHILTGWIICNAIMLAGKQINIRMAIIIHAVLTPAIFGVISWYYYKKYKFTNPLVTSCLFTSVVIFLDVNVLSIMILKNLYMFNSFSGTWLPYILIFLATWLSGFVFSEREVI